MENTQKVTVIPEGQMSVKADKKEKKPETLRAIAEGRKVALEMLDKTDNNISISKQGDIITITIDTSKYQRESGTGDSVTYASTNGNFVLPDKAQININFFRPYRYFAPAETGAERQERKVTVKGW